MQAYIYYLRLKQKVMDFLGDEQGDTNFVSIIIVLGIVLAIAAVFSENITKLVGDVWLKINGSSQKVLGYM